MVLVQFTLCKTTHLQLSQLAQVCDRLTALCCCITAESLLCVMPRGSFFKQAVPMHWLLTSITFEYVEHRTHHCSDSCMNNKQIVDSMQWSVCCLQFHKQWFCNWLSSILSYIVLSHVQTSTDSQELVH